METTNKAKLNTLETGNSVLEAIYRIFQLQKITIVIDGNEYVYDMNSLIVSQVIDLVTERKYYLLLSSKEDKKLNFLTELTMECRVSYIDVLQNVKLDEYHILIETKEPFINVFPPQLLYQRKFCLNKSLIQNILDAKPIQTIKRKHHRIYYNL